MPKRYFTTLILILILLVVLFFGLGFLAPKKTIAPAPADIKQPQGGAATPSETPQSKGPIGQPYVKGPSGPPPSQ